MIVGIDLSTKAVDISAVDGQGFFCLWKRIETAGENAHERALPLPAALPSERWWDEVEHVSIEEPIGAAFKAVATLNVVIGVLIASLPERLRLPERCWRVPQQEWKSGLGLREKPSARALVALGCAFDEGVFAGVTQDGLDAAALALWSQRVLTSGVGRTPTTGRRR